MGQKINQIGFRLVTTQNHHSFWFAHPKSFFMGLHEDEKNTRLYQELCKKKRISSGFEGIAGIEIQKRMDLIQVIIHIGFPNLLMQGRRRELEELKNLMDNV